MTTGAAVPTAGVRPATESDLTAIESMAAAAVATLGDARGARMMLARESPPPDAAALLGRDDAAVLVGVLDDVAVGAGIAHVEQLDADTRLAVVRMLWVDEEARGVGVGEALLEGLVAWARATGCASIDAYALPGERITKNFFEAAGFKARLLTVSHRLDDPAS